MDVLPSELLDRLCSHLPSPSLQSLRCTCKELAVIGEKYLFQAFEFRLTPNHHCLYQLEQLAAHPTIAPRLRCLAFESGIQLEYADFRYWQAQVYQNITKARSMSLATNASSSDDYEAFHSALQARFTPDMARRYDLYCLHLDRQASSMADRPVRDRMIRAMNRLHGHMSDVRLKLVMSERQITLEELEVWDSTEYESDIGQDPDLCRRVFTRRKNCLAHFINFLDAAQRSDLNVRKLVAVNLPHQLLISKSVQQASVLDDTFRGLTELDVKVGSFPHSDWLSRGGFHEVYFGGRHLAAVRVARLLNSPENLTSLRLEFPPAKAAVYSFDIFDRTNVDRFPRLWLPPLKSLSLCHISCTWRDLQALLEAATNAKTVKLSHCRLESGSLLDVLHFLSSMTLDSVAIEGKWHVDEDTGEWHSHDQTDFTDCFADTSYEGPYAGNGMRSKMERFMLSGGQCPLPRWTPENQAELTWEMAGDTSWHYLPGPIR